MKLQLASLAFGLVASFTVCATPISTWTFESATPFDLDNSGRSPVVAANTGIGSASGTHASSATDWKTREGNGSVRSISANNWAVGDYWQFEVSTVGYENITVSWDQMSSGTGPRDFGLFYSSDGALFTQFLSSFTVGASYTSFSKDLSAVIGISDDSSSLFRVSTL
ncbi:MAG: hypothetical protein IPK15_20685 [Verrucomicrobia bacterium]|nr:hypothetical protein [Verrucomicrobiota bacterium]